MTKYGAQGDEEFLVPQDGLAPAPSALATSNTTRVARVATVIVLGLIAGFGYASINHSVTDVSEIPKTMENLPEFSDLSATLPEEETGRSEIPFYECDAVAFLADSGKFLSRCQDCADSENPDTATVDGTNPREPRTQWKVERVSRHSVALRSDNGKLLSSCKDCISNATYPLSASINYTSSREGKESRWSITNLPNGKVGIRNVITRRFLGRCNQCAPGSPTDRAFVHGVNPNDKISQWRVVCLKGNKAVMWKGEKKRKEPLQACPSRKISLQAVNGMFLGRCTDRQKCRHGVHVRLDELSTKTAQDAKWTVVPVNEDTVALRARTGKYLARCDKCVTSGSPNVFVHVSNRRNPQAQWKVVTLANGKVALRSDVGRYLAIRRRSSNGDIRAFAIHRSYSSSSAQWRVLCHK